jgi:hypothetical protein
MSLTKSNIKYPINYKEFLENYSTLMLTEEIEELGKGEK